MAPELGRFWPFRKKRKPITSLVWLNGSEESHEAIDVASRIFTIGDSLKGAYVVEVPRKFQLDDELKEEANRGEEVLKEGEAFLANEGIVVGPGDFQLLQGREIGSAIAEVAEEVHADRIFVGVTVGPIKQEIGETAGHILKHAKPMVIVVRPSINKPIAK